LATSFVNPDGTMATVVMNQSELEISYNYIVSEREIELVSPPRSIQTLVW
jgi:glucosylceramidase